MKLVFSSISISKRVPVCKCVVHGVSIHRSYYISDRGLSYRVDEKVIWPLSQLRGRVFFNTKETRNVFNKDQGEKLKVYIRVNIGTLHRFHVCLAIRSSQTYPDLSDQTSQ